MSGTFVDISFLLAMVLEPDAHHEIALAWQQFVTGSLMEKKK